MTGWGTVRNLGRIAAAALALAGLGTAWAAEPDTARQQEILDFVHNTCVTCHGPGLVGEVGPPLTPAALKDKDTAMLAGTILNGRPDTQMMPFTGMISEDEAVWLVDQLKKGLDP